MSEEMHVQPEVVTTHEVHHDEHHVHHHKETFITKYIFSQDHKTIGKQFLITGIIWAVIGGLFSVLFRLQLGYPDQTFPYSSNCFWSLGRRRTNKTGVLLCIDHYARNSIGIFCIDSRT